MRNLLVPLMALVGASGCVVVNNTPAGPNHPDGAGGSQPGLATLTVHRIKPGASAVVQPGSQAGYAITANLGGSYRAVWTGDAGSSGTFREFWGTMWTPGHFSNLVPGCNGDVCALESDDFVSGIRQDSSGGERVDWDTFATTGLDGFDVVTDTEPVVFMMFIDGDARPDLVQFFSTDLNTQASAGALPFGLTTN